MSWLFFAILASVLYSISNIIDSYLSNAPVKHLLTLVCTGTIFQVLFIPIVWIFSPPGALNLSILPYIVIISILDIAYQYPYLRSLQQDDVSVVSSLFTLGKIFVPILAFIMLGETLELSQYAGFGVIIAASALLTLNGGKHLSVNASLGNMAFVSAILAIQAVLYRAVFASASWGTGFIWSTLISALFSAIIFLPRKDVRRDIQRVIKTRHGALALFTIEEFSTFCATACATYAIFLAPVTLYTGLSAIEPFFVMILGLILKHFIPKAAHESSDYARILKKTLLFILMIVGVLLVGGAN